MPTRPPSKLLATITPAAIQRAILPRVPVNPLARVGSMLHLLAASAAGVAIGGFTGCHLLESMNDAVPEVLAAVTANADDPAEPGPMRRRAVVVLIDGACGATLERSVDEGVLGDVPWRAKLDVGLPSLSRPVYHALLTGTPQWVSGIGYNGYARARADSVVARERDAGGRLGWALESVPWLDELFALPGDARLLGTDATTPERLAPWLDDNDLSIVHLTLPDHVGHAQGAASGAYERAVTRALQLVGHLRERAATTRSDDDPTVWFVGSDHGHTARGGHGGPEQDVRLVTWFAFGRGVARLTVDGTPPAAAMGATIASALGVPPPRHALELALPLFAAEATTAAPRVAVRRRVAAKAMAEHRRREGAWKLLTCAALIAMLSVAATRMGRRRALVAASLVASVGAAFVFLGPGLTLSAIRTERAFIAHTATVVSMTAAVSWVVLRNKGGRATDAAWANMLLPVGALLITHGSLGRSAPGSLGVLLYPTAGLVAAAANTGIVVVELAATIVGTLQRRTS